MAINVRCDSCGWTGTVHDSLAGETLACRACGESISVRAELEVVEGAEFEVVEDAAAAAKRQALADSAATPAASDKRTKKKPKPYEHLLPKKQPSVFNGRNLILLGNVMLVGSIIAIIVGAAFDALAAYLFVLLGAGLVTSSVGYAMGQEQGRG
jgi:hypothetical protein